MDTHTMSSLPLVDSLVKNRLFKTEPDIDELPFQFIHTMDLSVVYCYYYYYYYYYYKCHGLQCCHHTVAGALYKNSLLLRRPQQPVILFFGRLCL